MRQSHRAGLTIALIGLVLIGSSAPSAMAGGRLFRRRERVVVETVAPVSRPQDQVAPTGMLGSFVPTPMVTIRGNGVVGGGYSTLGMSGRENSLSVYGPLSAFRQTSAPVNTVLRGYDGIPVRVQGTGFSNPMQPTLSPFVYPTQSSNYSALPYQRTPPYRDKALMWIDEN
jgi:hypothetical protein